MKTNNVIIASEIRTHSSGMPIMVIKNEAGEDVGYLSPFRGYCFQVSATFDGQWDLGSSKVIGLRNVLRSNGGGNGPSNLDWTSTTYELLKGQAYIAMADFAIREKARLDLEWTDDTHGFITLSNGQEKFVNDIVDKFILEVVLYLEPNTKF